ncbi:TspO/MBR family protein [Acidisoma sp. 7E03]
MQTRWAWTVASLAVGAAAVAGGRFGPTPTRPRTAIWYARLRKPAVTPPGPVFGGAWGVLDGLLAYGGARLMMQQPGAARLAALWLWGLSVLGVGSFSWVFFGRKRLGEALGVTGGMAATSISLVAAAKAVDSKAAAAFVPLALWVAFASFLQEEVWRRN